MCNNVYTNVGCYGGTWESGANSQGGEVKGMPKYRAEVFFFSLFNEILVINHILGAPSSFGSALHFSAQYASNHSYASESYIFCIIYKE